MLALISASCNSTGLCFDPQIRNTFPCQLGQLGEVTFKHKNKERKLRGALRLGRFGESGKWVVNEQPFLFTKPLYPSSLTSALNPDNSLEGRGSQGCHFLLFTGLEKHS